MSLGRMMGGRAGGGGAGPGRAGSCKPGVRELCLVLSSALSSYEPGRNVASEGVS